MLLEKINEELKEALKAGDSFKVETLRLLISAIHNKEIEKRGKGLEPALGEEEVIEILGREAKKRKEAAEIYEKGNRSELADKEKKELELIGRYLPKALSTEEVEAVVNKILAGGESDFGLAMKEIMKELKGKADAGVVSGIVRKKLGN